MTSQEENPVLVLGAGPTGLFLSILLLHQGIKPITVDRASGTGSTSRALGVHARTLEIYRMIDPALADAVIAAGTKVDGIEYRNNGGKTVRATLSAGDVGKGISPYPFMLSCAQDVHEAVLYDWLQRKGGKVRWQTEVTRLEQDDSGVSATLKPKDGPAEETLRFRYVAGCDGAHSIARHASGIPMEGSTYAQRFYVADTYMDPSDVPKKFVLNFSSADFGLVVPLGKPGLVRLAGIVPAAQDPDRHCPAALHKPIDENHPEHSHNPSSEQTPIAFDDLSEQIYHTTGLRPAKVEWFSTYKAHHRLAPRFRDRRVFLVGDAAHLHSPVGGQGMNTGIGDAFNLGWKLGAAIKTPISTISSPSPTSLPVVLDTYSPERLSFARGLVATTDRLFSIVTSTGLIGWLFRNIFVPYVAPVLFHFTSTRRGGFVAASQVAIAYPDSALSEDTTGRSKPKTATGPFGAGSRLPWVRLDGQDGAFAAQAGASAADADNHASLAGYRWHAHVYGGSAAVSDDAPVKSLLAQRGIEIRRFPWTNEAAGAAGIAKDAVYLIRPDGYIGLICAPDDAAQLKEYLATWVS